MTRPKPRLSTALLNASLDSIRQDRGEPPWSDNVVVSDEFTVNAIYQSPGTANDRHYHIRDECWYVAKGEIIWHFEGGRDVHARAGDFVFAPKNTFHLIEPVGDGPSIRIGVGVTGEPHRHERD